MEGFSSMYELGKRFYRFYRDIYCPRDGFLYFDEACLIVENVLNTSISLSRVTEQCYQCNPIWWADVTSKKNSSLLVPIYGTTTFQYLAIGTNISSCKVTYQFEQHGVYLYIADLSCDSIQVLVYPDNPYTSFLVFAVIALSVWILYMPFSHISIKKQIHGLFTLPIAFFMKSKNIVEEHNLEELRIPRHDSISRASSKLVVSRKVIYDEDTDTERVVEYNSRGINTTDSLEEMEKSVFSEPNPLEFVEFESLLAFRGVMVVIWVFLVAENKSYYFFQSSPWHGLLLDDINIGWLYWVLAASFYLRMHHSFLQGSSQRQLYFRSVLLRSALYIFGGFVYNNINNTSPLKRSSRTPSPPLSESRVFGIFQRIGLVHLIMGSVEVYLIKRKIKRGRFFQDLKDTWPQWFFVGILVLLHTLITFFLPVPGCPTGYQGPGSRFGYPGCTGGAAGYIDRSLVTTRHMMWRSELVGGLGGGIYGLSIRFDPQGILGTLTTCLLMALGMQAARIFIYFLHPVGRIIRLIGWTAVQLLLGGLLCGFSLHDGFIPVNRYLMSLSYVLIVSGLAYLTLCLLYIFITYKRLWSGNPVIYSGVNLLPMLVGSKLFYCSLPFMWHIPESSWNTNTEFLVRATWCVSVWFFVCYQLLRHRIVCPV